MERREDDGQQHVQSKLTAAKGDSKSNEKQCVAHTKEPDQKKEKGLETDEENDTNGPTRVKKDTQCTEEPTYISNEPKPAEKDIQSTEEPVLELSKNLGTFQNLPEADVSAQNTNHDSENDLESGMDESEHNDKLCDALTTSSTDENSNSQIVQSNSGIDLNVICKSKFTLAQARTVDNQTLTDVELKSPDQIPEYILQALMIVDYRAREFELKSLITDKDKNKTSVTYDSDDETKNEDKNGNEGINPMDGLLWIFHCSDIFLQQALAMKLSTCQLSVPFLLPDPTDPSKNVTILLSALESVTKCWKSKSSENAQKVFATEYPFPVVSFIRIGEITMSKSYLINEIMSDSDVYHNFFFHKNMKGGHVKRKVVDGLVELCWYLPCGSKEQTLEEEICFANLRGDAKRFEKQLDVLSKISSILCILLSSECPDKEVATFLKKTTSTKASVILVFNEERQKDAKQHFKDLKSKRGSESGELLAITVSTKENRETFLDLMRRNIQQNIHQVTAAPLEELKSCRKMFGIELNHDEDRSQFELYKSIENWLNQGIKKAKKLLKLQKRVPVLAGLEREKHFPKRQGKTCRRDPDEIYKDIEKVMNAQKRSFAQMNEPILQFFNSIALMNETDQNFALNKLKRQLEKMSVKVMTNLHDKYSRALRNIRKEREKTCQETTDARSSDEEQLKKLKKSIGKCSLGMEHIVREFAQLYQLPDIVKKDFTGVAVKMLLSGQPLELLDGDSSYIPVKWFNAVYTELESRTNNANVFVISVLGIQSSGKSTMLNTMFGLEFPVSAGRCTRGAFVSLIPVSDSLKDASNFDYILVIDTEGLQGSGDIQQREHDNELATFAIGVADVTIVNVLGENQNEIKEFLEIAVHAFLKMNLVNEKKSCKIVHQNVAASDASDRLLFARNSLKKYLDKMTKVAATQENCEDQYQKFEDIISFDEKKDVFYIPSLLNGSPPMAPVNPRYGKAIREVKKTVIELMCSEERFQLSVSNFRERVKNLWTAMLKENFIFSFRNAIEVRAYTSLDRKYFEVSVNLMVLGMAELEREIQVSLERCTTRDEREEKWKVSKRQIGEVAEKFRANMEKEMNDFFKTSEDKVTLEQWKEHVMNKIVHFKENQAMEVENNCLASFTFLQNQQDVEEKTQEYEKELLQKAKKFISSAQYTGDTESSKAAFEKEWLQWIEDVPEYQEKGIDVNHEMGDALCCTNTVLATELTTKLREEKDNILNFKVPSPVIDKNQLKTNPSKKSPNFFKQQQQETVISANSISNNAIQKASYFAKNKLKSKVRCTKKDLTQMYHQVLTFLDEESRKYCFTFNKSLQCDILLCAFANAYEFFVEMEEHYIEKRNIRGNLEKNLRPKLQSYFLNLCSEMGKEVLAATAISEVLQNPIESELNKTMGSAVTSEIIRQSIYQSKGQFQASVLIKLGKDGKFASYKPYFEDPARFLKQKLKESIEEYCLRQECASITKRLENEASEIMKKVLAAISTASEQRKIKSGKLNFWIEQFVKNCSTLVIKTEMFAVAAMIKEDLKDFDVFEIKLCEKVRQFFNSLIKSGVNVTTFRKWDTSVYDQVVTIMFGCQNCCPFCKVFCDQTDYDHAGSHYSGVHRPSGLIGYKDVNTRILCHTICTNDVASTKSFRNLDTSGEWFPYKEYQLVNDYYKSWLIRQDDPSFETSTYWQWFMATYSKELAEHYKVKQPNIPEHWKKHTIEEVTEQLRLDYKIEKCE